MRGLRRRMMMGSKYERLEYIRGNSDVVGTMGKNTTYLDTGYVMPLNFKFEIDWMSLGNNTAFLFGSRTYYQASDEFSASTTYLNVGNTSRMGLYVKNNNKIKSVITPTKVESNGHSYSYSSNYSGGVYPLLLFCTTTNDNKNQPIYPCGNACRIYNVKIYDNDVLVRDFIPVRRRSDSKIGMLDKVENKFYTSPNGVEFTGG